MRNYMIRRVGHSFFVIMGLMALLFFAINILGDPVLLLVDEDASQEAIDAMRERLGLDRPLYVRFGDFYWDLARGDFGTSLRHRIPARDMIFNRLPNTIVLGLVAWGIGMVGLPLGMLAARRPRGIIDRFVNILSFGVISIPEFWLALMLILFVSVQMGVLPTSGYEGLGPDGWKFLILPAITLAPRVVGRNAQITRATMIEEINKQYVATARSKGLAENTILYGHVLKNAAISIVTLMGDELAGLVNGAIVVEVIFGWPGIGQLLISAISARDLPVITGTVLVVAVMVMLINLAVDLIYTWLDPRISYS